MQNVFRHDKYFNSNKKSRATPPTDTEFCSAILYFMVYNHLELHDIYKNFPSTLWAIQREIYQNRIVVHLGSGLSFTDWAMYPSWFFIMSFHKITRFTFCCICSASGVWLAAIYLYLDLFSPLLLI